MDTQETKIYIAALIAAGILGIILVYFIITMIRQQRRTQALNREKIHAEILTTEKERKRIAKDLHDDLGPMLSAIKFKITSVDLLSEEDKQLISDASKHIDDSLHRIREISFDLMPNALLRKGLIATLEELIPKFEKLTNLEIRFANGTLPALPSDTVINLYRVILEIINNTVKHARSVTLNIELKQVNNKLVLLTEDKGIGFQFDQQAGENKGLGLRNLQSRAEIMNADLVVDTAPGKGTKYILEIPI
jgi:signal transduction histidine kinase